MALFGRRRSAKNEVEVQEEAAEQPAPEETAPAEPVLGDRTADELGPFDSGAVPRPEGFLDFGSLWLPNLLGVVFMVETDQSSGEVTGLRLQIAQSVLQLQVFAAPTSRRLWDEIRSEIIAGLAGNGGRAEERTGPYGDELIATVSAPAATGGAAATSMRFIGVDGRRWFLRGVVSGPAATDEALAKPFVDLLRVVVVHRGDAPRAPRELLPMHMPRNIEAAEHAESPGGAPRDQLRPFERGPEITEVR